VTLQPVRRHGVDAAVLFADIMSPVLGMGVEVELVEGVGPVVEHAVDSAKEVERLRVAGARGVGGADPRGRAARARRARARAGAGRLLRRAVHRCRLSRRGQAEPRLRPH
jgi:hypothetical protein